MPSKSKHRRSAKGKAGIPPLGIKTYLGDGSYGCVYSTVDKVDRTCIKKLGVSPSRSSGLVSKLMLSEDAKSEFAQTQTLIKRIKQQIPDYEKYFIIPMGVCPVDKTLSSGLGKEIVAKLKKKNTSSLSLTMRASNGGIPARMCLAKIIKRKVNKAMSEKKKEDLVRLTKASVSSIISLNGGVDLHTWSSLFLKQRQSVPSFLYGIANVLHGIRLLLSHGIIHGDVGLENIVVEKTPPRGHSSLPQFRLIDFGMSVSFDSKDVVPHTATPALLTSSSTLHLASLGRMTKLRTVPETMAWDRSFIPSSAAFQDAAWLSRYRRKASRIYDQLEEFASKDNVDKVLRILGYSQNNPCYKAILTCAKKAALLYTEAVDKPGTCLMSLISMYKNPTPSLIAMHLRSIDTFWLGMETIRFLTGSRVCVLFLWAEQVFPSSPTQAANFFLTLFDFLFSLIAPESSRRVHGLEAAEVYTTSILNPYRTHLSKAYAFKER